MISSTHNPRIQLVRSLLSDRQARASTQAFVLEGVRLVEEAVRTDWPLEQVLFDESLSDRGRALLDACRQKGIPCEEVARRVLESISDTGNSQGILAVAKMKDLPIEPHPDFVLIADSIRDPGNLGTLLRTAAAAGVDLVLLTPGTADAFNPKVVRSAMGAHFHLPIQTMSWGNIAAQFKPELKFYLAEMESSSPIWDVELRHPLAVVIGGEAEGAGEEARRLADLAVHIPMSARTESLNAAVAAGIILFEVVRQRKA